MAAAFSPSFARRALASPRAGWASEGLHRIEIVAPDEERAALLLEYASPLFPTELVAGSALTVRMQPPSTGSSWVFELLSLVERWLESARLPSADVLYGGHNYPIRTSTRAQGGTDGLPAL